MADEHGSASDEAGNAAANDRTAAHAPLAHEPAGTHEATPGAHEPDLGPIDWPAWGAGALGVALGLVTLASLYLAAHPLG